MSQANIVIMRQVNKIDFHWDSTDIAVISCLSCSRLMTKKLTYHSRLTFQDVRV
jgi:hypothetical protein